MAMPMDLVLLRHGEGENNIANRRSKSGDHTLFTKDFISRHSSSFRLTSLGEEQAKSAGEWIRLNISSIFDRYYSSEYVRAMETAANLGLPEASWLLSVYLRERDYGEMDVVSQEDFADRFAESIRLRDINPFYWAPPAGESMAQVCLRIEKTLSTLHRECSGKKVIIVCHGEIMWAMRFILERMSQARYHELHLSSDPHDRINNCQVLHYSRQHPITRTVSPYLSLMRSVCPWDTELSSNEWEEIERPKYTNEELFNKVHGIPRIIL